MNFQDYFDYILEHANNEEIPKRFHALLNNEPSQEQLTYAQYLVDMYIEELTRYGSMTMTFKNPENIMKISGIISDFNISEDFIDCLEPKSQLVVSEIISILLEEGTLIDYVAIHNRGIHKGYLDSTGYVLPENMICTPMTVREHMTHMGYDDIDFQTEPTKNQLDYLRMLVNEKYYKYFSLYSSEKGRFGELKNYTNMFKDFPKSSDTDDYLIQHFSKREFSEMIDFAKGNYRTLDYHHAFKQK